MIDNERYEIIYSNNELLFNDKIPILITSIITAEDKYTGKEIVKVLIRNTGIKTLQYIKIKIDFIDNQGKTRGNQSYDYGNMDVSLNEEEELVCEVNTKNVDKKDVPQITIEGIKLEDEDTILDCLKLTIIRDGEDLDDLKELKTQYIREIKKINGFAKVESKYVSRANYWNCICGNIYFKDVPKCIICNIDRKKLESITDEDYLKNELKKYEEEQKELKKKAIETAKKVGNKSFKAAIFIAVALTIGVIIFFVGKVIIIKNMIKDADIDGAMRINSNVLIDYKDYIFELISEYDKLNNLDKKIELLKNINEYSLSDDYKNAYSEAEFELLKVEYKSNNFEEAYSIILELKNYEKYNNNAEFETIKGKVYYYKSLKFIWDKQYDNAIELLNVIDYKDSKKLIDVANYLIAKEYFDNNNYQSAIEYFNKLSEPYENSNELMEEATYEDIIYRYESYKTSNSYDLSSLRSLKKEFANLNNYKESYKYIKEIEEALKWHGVWRHNILSSSSYNVKFNYFTGEFKGPTTVTMEKQGDKYVGRIYSSQYTLRLDGDLLIYNYKGDNFKYTTEYRR